MRIEDVEAKEAVHLLGLALTRAEAQELRDTLDALLMAADGRHEHVSSADYQTEMTIWIEDTE
jgi:hypothetical protein